MTMVIKSGIVRLGLWIAWSHSAVAATTRRSRELSEDSHDNSGSSGDYNYDGDNDSANGNSVTQAMSSATQRIRQDMGNMWDSSPSSWGNEYWEVFGGALVIAFGIIMCLCLVCCAPICLFSRDETPPMRIATAEELQAEKERKNSMKQPILDKDVENPAHQPIAETKSSYSAPTLTPTLPSASEDAEVLENPTDQTSDSVPTNRTMSTDNDVCQAPSQKNSFPTQQSMGPTSIGSPGSSTMNQESRYSKSHPPRRSLWSEVVLVWTEFFKHGLNSPPEEVAAYHRYQQKQMQKQRSRKQMQLVKALRKQRKRAAKNSATQSLREEVKSENEEETMVDKTQAVVV